LKEVLTAKLAGFTRRRARESWAQQGPAERVVILAREITSLKSLSFLVRMFRRSVPTKQFS
jgi:hypothetical protein